MRKERIRCIFARSDKNSNNTYPFDKSDKIELISYDTRRDSYSNDELIIAGEFKFSKAAVTKISQRRLHFWRFALNVMEDE